MFCRFGNLESYKFDKICRSSGIIKLENGAHFSISENSNYANLIVSVCVDYATVFCASC